MGKYLNLIRPRSPSAEDLDLNAPCSTERAGLSDGKSCRSTGPSPADRTPAGSTTETTLTTEGPRKDAPPGPDGVTTETTETTETTKAPLHRESVVDMPLSQFEREGYPIEIQVPGLTETLWFVPGIDDVHRLVSRDIRRGRIWTAAELRVITAIPDAGQDDLVTLARVKARFDGEVFAAEGVQ